MSQFQSWVLFYWKTPFQPKPVLVDVVEVYQ